MEGHEADAGDGLGEAVLKKIANLRIWSLFIKELLQIRRNRRLVIMLIIPPTLNIILFGIALNPNFENLRLGIVDYSGTPQSRDLISAFTESLVFRIDGYFPSPDEMGEVINRGNLDAGLVIPRDFAERKVRHETARVQLLVDAVNANTATIAGGYAARIIGQSNQTITESREGGRLSAITMSVPAPSVTAHLTLLYNPG